jgi:hypothetical protein
MRISPHVLQGCECCFTEALEVKFPQMTVTQVVYRADFLAHLHTTLLRVGISDEIMRADDGKRNLLKCIEWGEKGNPRLVVTCLEREIMALEDMPVTPFSVKTLVQRGEYVPRKRRVR